MSAILAPTKRVTALLVASALSWSALAPVAYADEKPKDKKETIKPPSMMSSVGGVRLGKPGTQVDLGTGAPVLPKDLTGRSWIVADAESGAVLAAHNAHWRLPPASTLKMLFADTVLPKFPKTQNHKVAPSDLAGLEVAPAWSASRRNRRTRSTICGSASSSAPATTPYVSSPR